MKSLGRMVVILAMVVALTGFMTLSAHAGLMGPSVTFNLTNFPGGATTITETLGSGLSSSGDVQVYSFTVATAGGGEYDYFFFNTISGGPLAANSAALWQIDANFTLTQAVNFNGIEDQWTTGGFSGTPVPLASLTPSGFINVAGTGPIGDGYVNGYGTTGSAFSDLIAAGLQDFPTFVSPYSFANTGGGIPTAANGFNIVYHFDPVPLPGSVFLFGSGFLGLAGWRFRKSRVVI
jgi:hypothetical protein